MYKFSKYKEQYRENLKLALPVMLSQLGHVIVQLADNIMVGRYGGSDPLPLAAAAFGGGLFFLFYVTTMGLTLSITPLVGELYAQGKKGRTVRYLLNGMVLYLAVSVVVTALLCAIIPLMWMMGQPDDVVLKAIPYFKTLVFSLVPAIVFFVVKQFLEGLGNTKVAMYAVIFSNVVNIFFNYLLIGGKWGAPEMGVTGAGVATLISRYVLCATLVGYLFWGKELRDYRRYFSRRLLSLQVMVRTISLGIPIALQIFLEASTFVVVGFMCGWFGAISITVNQIGISLSNCSFMIIVALASATTIRISHCYGRGDVKQMRLASAAAWHLALMWNICAALFYLFGRYWIPTLFSANEHVIELASYMILFIAAYQIPDALQCIGVGIMRGMQDMNSIPRVALVSYWLCNIPVGCLCAFVFGMGILGFYVGFIVGFAVATYIIMSHIHRAQRSLEPSPEVVC